MQKTLRVLWFFWGILGFYQSMPTYANTTAANPEATSTASAKQYNRSQIHQWINEAADRHGIERTLAHSIVHAESNYNATAISTAGAMGLMQVMPATAGNYGVVDSQQLYDPQVNINVGMRHLAYLKKKYAGDVGRMVMAYNAGEGALAKAGGKVVRFRETMNYTNVVLNEYMRAGGKQKLLAEQTLAQVRQIQAMGGGKAAIAQARRFLDFRKLKVNSQLNLGLSAPWQDLSYQRKIMGPIQ